MVVVDFILDALFWSFVGAAGTVFFLKGSFSCISLAGIATCVSHDFNMMSIFGM